jgi:uncharacterized zinc-type alcohol dehydrogenase-like protein
MTVIDAFAAPSPRASFAPISYDPGPLAADEVEIKVDYCGVCHSDLSMRNNDWGITQFPFVGGHEIVGRVVAKGGEVPSLALGDRVGLGWYARSDLSDRRCLCGDHHLAPGNSSTIVGRHGGFADRVRAQWVWAIPLPQALDAETAGPLFCGGITVFTPIVDYGVKPTDRVAVFGIGGLGHLAVQFLSKWGCDVTAFSSSPGKAAEARLMGAHDVVSSTDVASWAKLRGRFDFVIVTVNVPLDWAALAQTLSPRGRLHIVGAVLEPITLPLSALMGQQRSLSSSPVGGPATTATMLDFCARHAIRPMIEEFPLTRINDAFERLESGKTRYRIVLRNDLAA